MEHDFSRLAAVTDWSGQIDRTIAAVSGRTVDPLVLAMAEDTVAARAARELAGTTALAELTHLLEVSDQGAALTRHLASGVAGRRLVERLIDGQAAAELARGLSGSDDADGQMGTVVGTDTRIARAWAPYVVNNSAIRSRAERILSQPSAWIRAQALLDGATGAQLAAHLGGDQSGRSLIHHLGISRSAGALAKALADRRADAAVVHALARSPAARELAGEILAAPDGYRLVVDLLNGRAGSALRLGLPEHRQGQALLANLMADKAAIRLNSALGAATAQQSSAPGRHVDGRVDEAVAVLRVVVVIVLLLVLIIEPLALAAVVMTVAGVAGGPGPADDGAAGAPDATFGDRLVPSSTMPVEQRLHLRIDVGRQASLAELAQVVTDVETVVGLAARWVAHHRPSGFEPSDPADHHRAGAVAVAPPRAAFGADDLRVEELTYRNPIDIGLVGELAPVVALVFGAMVMPAELRKRDAEARLAELEVVDKVGALLGGEARQAAAIDLISRDPELVAALQRLARRPISVPSGSSGSSGSTVSPTGPGRPSPT